MGSMHLFSSWHIGKQTIYPYLCVFIIHAFYLVLLGQFHFYSVNIKIWYISNAK